MMHNTSLPTDGGIFAVYKPVGITSYDVIRQLKNVYPGKKIGHGGTLDPQAEGVLVVGVGKDATRQLAHVLKNTQKEYVAEFTLGKTSVTDDSEGPIGKGGSDVPDETKIRGFLNQFQGDIQQVPPRYSAIKIDGVPAYKRARRGETFHIEPKSVHIDAIELLAYDYPKVHIKIISGSGVYIRALARDLGQKLQTGAYMSALQRTRVGDFTVKDAYIFQK